MILQNADHSVDLSDHHITIRLANAGMAMECDAFRWKLSGPVGVDHQITSRNQRLNDLKKTATGALLTWESPLKAEEGAEFEINVRLEIRLVDKAVEFLISISNRSPATIVEAAYPLLADL